MNRTEPMDALLHLKLDLIAESLNSYRIETVTAVVHRVYTKSDGEEAHVIDMYPPWNDYGTYGKMKVASEYMDHDWQKERFAKFSGVSVDELPVYEAETAVRRRFGVTHPKEVEVRPFRLLTQPRTAADGNDLKTLIKKYLVSPNLPQETRKPETKSEPVQNEEPQPKKESEPTKNSDVSHWRKEAIEAGDPLMFDSAIVKFVPGITEVSTAEWTRKRMFGDSFQPDHAAAYVVGIETAMREYHTLYEDPAQDQRSAWNQGMGKGLEAYRKIVDSAATQAGLPLEKGGTNYGPND